MTERQQTHSPVMLSSEQFAYLIHQIQASAANASAANIAQPQGNFSRCTSRFDGAKTSDVAAFIDAVVTYKDCANVSDANALKGLPILLTDLAATWWQGVKYTVDTWDTAIELLRQTYGPKKPAFRVYRELFSQVQEDDTPSDIFVCKARALLAKLPYATPLPESIQLDMVYGLLAYKIRKEIPRERFATFAELLDLARAVEETRAEDPIVLEDPPKQSASPRKTEYRPRCKYCKNFGHTIEDCRSVRKKHDDGKDASSKRDKLEADSGLSPGNKQRAQPMISCFGCGEPGYLRKDCPKCNIKEASRKSEIKSEFCLIDASEVHARYKNRPILDVEILGANGTGLIDTAAKLSIAGSSLYRILAERGQQFKETKLRIGLADGTRNEERVLLTEVDVRIANRTIWTTFIVIPHARNNFTLFGMDFIEDANIVLNIPQRTWYFADDYEPHELKFEDSAETPATLQISYANTLRDDEALNLSGDQRAKLDELLDANEDIFGLGGEPTSYAEHAIDTGDNAPVASPPYRMSPAKKEILERELNLMLESGVIEECESPWAAPVVLRPKQDGSVRICIDYRRLNAITKTDSYPMPRIDELIHLAKKSLYMSTIDLRSGYWQVGVRPEDRDKTAFTTPFGTFRFRRMPFGLKNAGATFQRMMDRFKRGLKDTVVIVYLDDIIVISTNFEEHLQDLQKVFERLREFKLRAKREKCSFARPQVKFLGHIISEEGIRPNEDKVAAILNLPPPENVKHLITFLQTASWFRRFIPEFAGIAKPLTELTKKNVAWMWSRDQEEAYDKLKKLLSDAPVLRQADETLPFIIRTDASNYAIGAVLLQGEGIEEKPVEYASRLLTSAERNYSTTEREALAVVWAVGKFRGYIDGAKVNICTDHQPLRWLMGLKSPSGRLARWALSLQEYDLEIKYTPGKLNAVADTLSRPPCSEDTVKGCGVCTISIDLPSDGAAKLREEQLSDPEVKKIIEAFESKDDLNVANWVSRGYLMTNGVLYRYAPMEDTEEAQWVVPKCAVERILHENHDSPIAGHYGVDKTLRRISSKYYWPGMRKTVSDHVKKCLECERYKPSNLKPSGLLRTPAASRRFEVLSMDLFGPLPTTVEGFQWIYIIEDVATKWVEIFPLKRATAEACARILIDEVMLRYGIPRRVISDNGSQFVGAVMQQVSYCLGFSQSLIPVYHPEANPVERKNRDLKTQLSILTRNEHSTWAEKLPSIRYAMNSTVTQSTGKTPAYLAFAREMRDPGEVQRDLRGIVIGENFVSEVTPYLMKIADTLKEAIEVQESEQDRRKSYADGSRRSATTFKEGDLITVKTRVLSKAAQGVTSKFAPKRDGPYRIAKQISPVSYQIACNSTGEILSVRHVSDLETWRGGKDENVPAEPVQPLRKRGRPRKTTAPPLSEEDVGSSSKPSARSKGGVCSAKGPVTRSMSAATR